MNILQLIIPGMNKEQVRFFKLYSGRIVTSGERKDLQLFDYIRKTGKDYDDDIAFSKIYKGEDKNAFYRLKNRLTNDINKSLTIHHFDEDDFIYACHMLALYRFFSSRNLWNESHYYLRKAETCAVSMENYELLDLIYGEYIRLSHETLHINPELYIKKRMENQQQLMQIRAIDDLLAAVTYRLKVSQNLSSRKNPLLDLLQKSIDNFVKDKDLRKSPTLRFRLYKAVSQLLLQQHDYEALEEYLLTVFPEFEKDKLFDKSNHDLKLQMLTYIVNTLFKNNKLKQSLQYAEKLKSAMEEYHHLLYDKYIFFYYNAQVINYSQLNPQKAREILEDLKDNEKIISNSFYHLFVYLNLAVILFTLKQYKDAAKHISRLYLLEGYKTAQPALKLKIHIAELIIRYQLGDLEVLASKLQLVKKDFASLLNSEEMLNEKEIIAIISELITSKRSKRLKERIQRFLEDESPAGEGDAEVISYRNWLQSLPESR